MLATGRRWRTRSAASVAPSARALLESGTAITGREGVATLGDPRPTHQELQWGEAEALTLAKLGGNAYRARIHEQATREWLLEALRTAEVVDACCHGEFDPLDFLRSRLLLAKGERLTLGEMLGGETHMDGLRLLILSACQTAILDLRGARDEVRSLAAGMLQAGAQAVLGAQWSVDDKATYLLMTRFAQEWLPVRDREAPAAALARAKHWLRSITNRELRGWEAQAQGLPDSDRRHLRANWWPRVAAACATARRRRRNASPLQPLPRPTTHAPSPTLSTGRPSRSPAGNRFCTIYSRMPSPGWIVAERPALSKRASLFPSHNTCPMLWRRIRQTAGASQSRGSAMEWWQR